MAILEQKHTEGDSGFQKKFEAGAESLLFDFVQQDQYKFPVSSAIRELVSNCRDSITEKQMFFDIISGIAKVSDFYVEQEGELYKDSKFDPAYYEEKWLSKTENKIKLIYKVNNSAQRDTFHIIDTGVGLGGLRLEKSFNPLYSSKRLNKSQLGKFGIGSKAGLALQVDYYTLISRYNGCEFHFNVYDYKVDPTVPRMNTVTGGTNPFYTTQVITDRAGNPMDFYYLPTDKPNGVEIILQAKKGLRKEFIDGVKSQLLYLDGIEFELHENDEVFPQVVKAEIEYQDDIFVLPTANSTYYSKPHLILNGICYGYVEWLQLEEEERAGNIGIKIDPSAVDVNPNRESVRWTEKTRTAIHNVFKQGEFIAEKLINEALVSTDIMDWLLKSAAAMGGADQNSIIGRFANIVDVKSMKPKFSPMPKIKFDRNPEYFFAGYDVDLVIPQKKFSKSKQMDIPSLERKPVFSWQDFNDRQVYYQDTDTSFKAEMFLLSLYPQGFIKITPRGKSFDQNKERVWLTKSEEAMLELTYEQWKVMDFKARDEHYAAQRKKWKEQAALMDSLIQESKYTELYSSIKVPESFSVYEKEDDEDTAEAVEKVIKDMTDAERRKLENRIVIHSLRFHTARAGYTDFYTKGKYEPRIKEILNERETIIYGFQEDEKNLQIVAALLEKTNTDFNCDTWTNMDTKVVMISQSNAKYFKHHMFVNDFFMSYNTDSKTISMHNKLVKWQTARRIQAEMPKLNFLLNFRLFDPVAAATYSELQDYVNLNYVNLKAEGDVIPTLENYADKITEFQLFVMAHPGNTEAIAAKSKALFDTNEDGSFKDAIGIEFEPFRKMQQLLEVVTPVQLLLNQVECLTSSYTISFDLEKEIKEYLTQKGYISLSNTVSAPTLQVAEPAELTEA
jgi:hypothetical protein